MSTIDEKIQDQLRRLTEGKIFQFPATVKAVDKNTNTITVVDALELEYDDVRLGGIAGATDGVICYPVKDTTVLVTIINGEENELVVSAYEKIESMTVKVEQINLVVDKDRIQLNGDSYTLLKGAETVAQIKKTNAQVKALLQVLGGVPITEPGNGAPSALQTALNGAVTSLPDADYSNLENDKVKHG